MNGVSEHGNEIMTLRGHTENKFLNGGPKMASHSPVWGGRLSLVVKASGQALTTTKKKSCADFNLRKLGSFFWSETMIKFR
jgi:hypothetical protein